MFTSLKCNPRLSAAGSPPKCHPGVGSPAPIPRWRCKHRARPELPFSPGLAPEKAVYEFRVFYPWDPRTNCPLVYDAQRQTRSSVWFWLNVQPESRRWCMSPIRTPIPFSGETRPLWGHLSTVGSCISSYQLILTAIYDTYLGRIFFWHHPCFPFSYSAFCSGFLFSNGECSDRFRSFESSCFFVKLFESGGFLTQSFFLIRSTFRILQSIYNFELFLIHLEP